MCRNVNNTCVISLKIFPTLLQIIQAVQPHVVAVELCKARVGILQLDEEALFSYTKDISYKTIMDTVKREGFYNGLLHILLLRMAAHVAKQLDMPPGGEFRRAFEEAKKIPNCIVHLADRPISITMKRAIRLLSWWQTLRLGWHLAVMKDPITQADVELCKERSMLDEMIASMKEQFPVLGEVVPPPSLSSKILKVTVKASILGAVMYASYKILKVPATITFHTFKSSVEGLLQVGAAR
ncbi:hypothetical protein DMN91_010583 [Ooceraea biroi]|uniref:Uncharacterized protein n=1 Tax=Ooceraea biroi TaxID=2015173 RepID=A0A3L8D7T8_OOCBI|nr:hypothetical protein DMN91_010583 [Ooceraea biroi]